MAAFELNYDILLHRAFKIQLRTTHLVRLFILPNSKLHFSPDNWLFLPIFKTYFSNLTQILLFSFLKLSMLLIFENYTTIELKRCL